MTRIPLAFVALLDPLNDPRTNRRNTLFTAEEGCVLSLYPETNCVCVELNGGEAENIPLARVLRFRFHLKETP